MIVQYTGTTIPGKIENGELRIVEASMETKCLLKSRDGKSTAGWMPKEHLKPADDEAKRYMIFGE